MKTLRSFLAISLALVLLTSCGKAAPQAPAPQAPVQPETPQAPAAPEAPQAPAGPAYKSQSPFIEAWNNPLEHEFMDEDRDPGYISYPVVSGLKNSRLESTINHRIVNQVQKAAQWKVPPYRGTGALDPATFDGKSSRGFWVSVPFSCNDYLSFSGSYNLTDETYQNNYSDIWTMNYDLRTGKEIKLADLFTPGYDYKSVINKRVIQALQKKSADTEFFRNDTVYEGWEAAAEIEMDSVKLVAPFKGIGDDQRFYLSNYGISVILSYENPELDFVGYYKEPVIVSVSYSDFEDGMLMARGCNADLYTSGEEPRKVLLSSLGGNVVNEKVPLYEGKLPISADMIFTYPEHMDPALVARMKADLKDMTEPLSEYISACRKDPEQSYHFVYMAYAQINGPYTSYNLNVSVPPVQDGDYYNAEAYHTFDQQGRELRAADFFDRNFNAAAHLAQRFEEDYEMIGTYGNHASFEPDFREMAENALVYVTSFNISFYAPYSFLVTNDQYHYDYFYRPTYDVIYDDDEALILKY